MVYETTYASELTMVPVGPRFAQIDRDGHREPHLGYA
jgi:hypothetical protein